MKKFFFILLLSGCNIINNDTDNEKKILILVSVEPYIEMVKEIAQDKVNVISVIPHGVDPHNWEPTISKIGKLNDATAWFTIGESFENTLYKKLKEKNQNLIKIDLLSTIEKIQSLDMCPNCSDTHAWLSPKDDIKQGEIIYNFLSAAMPEYDNLFSKNFNLLKNRLIELDKNIKNTLASYKGKILLTTHGAYAYFCRDYGLTQIVISPFHGQEPRSKSIVNLINDLKKKNNSIAVIFLQPNHNNKPTIKIAEQFSIPTHVNDPYKQNYIKTIEDIANDITTNGE